MFGLEPPLRPTSAKRPFRVVLVFPVALTADQSRSFRQVPCQFPCRVTRTVPREALGRALPQAPR